MAMSTDPLFTRLAPVLNVSDLAAERAFYEKLGLPVIYEGDEYPDFIAFGTDTINFGIQQADRRQRSTQRPHLADRRLRRRRRRRTLPDRGTRLRARGQRAGPRLEVPPPPPPTPSGYRLALEGESE